MHQLKETDLLSREFDIFYTIQERITYLLTVSRMLDFEIKGWWRCLIWTV